MLSSITPLGERARNRRWATTVMFYGVGSIVGGGFLGILFGWLGSLVPVSWQLHGLALAVLSTSLLAAAAVVEAGVVDVSLPSMHRQVNEDWLGLYRGWVVGLGFGIQLGFALVIMITSAVTYVMIALMFLTHSPAAGMAIGLTFGLVRALPILTTHSVDSASSLRTFHSRMGTLAPVARRAVASSMTVFAGAALLVGVVA